MREDGRKEDGQKSRGESVGGERGEGRAMIHLMAARVTS